MLQDLNNRWNQKLMAIDNNRRQSISINGMVLIIDGQSITKIFVIIDYHKLSISIDNRWESINSLYAPPPPPAWLAVIFLQKRSDILQGKCKKKTVLELSATTTTTMVIYIFIYSTGYHLVSEPSQAGKRGKICTRTEQSDSWVTLNKQNKQRMVINFISCHCSVHHNPFYNIFGSG